MSQPPSDQPSDRFYVVHAEVQVIPPKPASLALFSDRGLAGCIVKAPNEDAAVQMLIDYLESQQWRVLQITLFQDTHPDQALGFPDLELLVEKARQYGVGALISVPAVDSSTGPAH